MTFPQVLASAASLTIGLPVVLTLAPADLIYAVVKAMPTESPNAPLHEGAGSYLVEANLQ